MNDYSKWSEEALIAAVKKDDGYAKETLINRYADTVNNYAKRYSSLGVEKDDLAQEGKLGVIKAAKSFNGDGVFFAFCVRCIKSAMITAIRRFNAAKNIPLNSSVSLSDAEGMEGKHDPEKELIVSEEEKELFARLKEELSDFEYAVLELYLYDYSGTEIAKKLGTGVKAVDNALQRIKKKLSK